MLDGRPLPAWFDDAKFGIFIHWTPASVPAFAPRSGRVWDVPDQFRDNPYVEWYYNSLKIEGSPVARFHAERYGADYPYEKFAAEFKRRSAAMDPEYWASVFARAGAKYAVFVTKHHDGFTLWPSRHRSPHVPDGYWSDRDLVGELGEAVRRKGLRYGLYYSGGLDWRWHDVTIKSFADFVAAIPRDPAYIDYAYDHWRELIERYEPASLWNDIAMPGPTERVLELFEHYYGAVPDGVVNDRWKSRMGPNGIEVSIHHDMRTPEYTVEAEIREKKWETCRGIGHSFGYNAEEPDEDHIAPDALIRMFVDIVSKNGNLLLNVGPRADGSIPREQESRLEALGAWLSANGEAIYGTRPWTRAGTTTTDGAEVRFTTKGEALYIHLLGGDSPGRVVLSGLALDAGAPMSTLRAGAELVWSNTPEGLAVALPPGGAGEPVLVLKTRLAAAR